MTPTVLIMVEQLVSWLPYVVVLLFISYSNILVCPASWEPGRQTVGMENYTLIN